MKNLKRNLAICMSLLMIPLMLMGCKPKVGPDETAKTLVEFAIKGDQSGVSKIGVSQSEINDAVKAEKDDFLKEIKSSFTTQGLNVTDAQVNAIYNAVMDDFKKVTVTTQVASQNDKTAEIKLKSTYFDLEAISVKAANNVIAQFKDSQIADEKERKTKVTDAFVKNLITELKNAKPSEAKEKTFKFVVKDKVWLPENESQFFSDVAKLVSGQK
ncbi:DUF5105 domain-containing protein [Clostridium sp. JS66]|uniref:DUF5105 domain-containing protein n=1 Tax=Clostridium sp. JS66 TaxID=3064705 RepID=UPI00298EC14A|nr:DUF5105 domain-containing protein [Clostridium sp. JS66]WPC40572.1 DUF5105 domain-containing protein [Clostridium sp. JS66]